MEKKMMFVIGLNYFMAQLELHPATAAKTKRKLHAALRIDMTPMVDLGFLLITFFIFTTTMAEPKAMSLAMPKDGDSTELASSKAFTILLAADNKVYAYEGEWNEALKNNRIIFTNYQTSEGIGKLIREKQKTMDAKKINGKNDLTLLIKPATKASYKNLIDALDETLINNVKKYAVVKLTKEENEFLSGKN